MAAKKRRPARKQTRTQALEKRVARLEKQSKAKSTLVEHLKTVGTGAAIFSALYTHKGPREILALVKERLLMP